MLKSLGQTVDVPRVMLRESQTDRSDPIARPKSPEMPTGDSDSRYQLQGEIARGGMGAIIKGRDTDLGVIWRSRCCWILTRTSLR